MTILLTYMYTYIYIYIDCYVHELEPSPVSGRASRDGASTTAVLGIHQRGVQSQGAAVDGGSII